MCDVCAGDGCMWCEGLTLDELMARIGDLFEEDDDE